MSLSHKDMFILGLIGLVILFSGTGLIVSIFHKSDPLYPIVTTPEISLEEKCHDMGGEVYTTPKKNGVTWICALDLSIQ